MSLKRTPLYEAHQALQGKIVPFAGWELPVQYSGVIAEHQAVRTKAGLFDVSHMGEVFVSGKEAQAAIDALTCNDLNKLYDGKALYSAIINERAGIVDDIIVYRISQDRFLICVNASNTDKDFEWFQKHNKKDALFENRSAEYGQIALQGPNAPAIIATLAGGERIAALKPFHFAQCDVEGIPVIAARTGYTGEDGFELFTPRDGSESIWNLLIERGAPNGLIPCGLGARDSLRLEACYPLHGHELSDDLTAIESDLGWIVKPEKGEFTGREILAREKREGAKRSLVGFFVEDAGIVREGASILSDNGEKIGWVTSGTKTPTVNRALGLAIVGSEYSKEGTVLQAEVRGRLLKCRIVKKPFYKRGA